MTPGPGEREIFVGLMSGTSADGIDAVLVSFDADGLQILGHRPAPYPDDLRRSVRTAATDDNLPVNDILLLDRALGEFAAEAVNALLAESGTGKETVRAIGSHGQTIRHLPMHHCSWQIGDPNRIAQLTGVTTVADFRRRDLAVSGQGAPLTPAFHDKVFRRQGEFRVILNIGGMANLTLLPADLAHSPGGYDTGPGNRLMDHWVHEHRGLPFDDRGQWAASGKVHADLLASLLGDPYFLQSPPKSTGPERFSATWLNGHLAAVPGLDPADVQATLTELTAASIAQEIDRLDPPPDAVYLCGGGTFNSHLASRLAARLPDVRLESTDTLGVPPQLVEAAAFAWLARQTLRGEPGNLPSVTGATEAVILGAIYPA